MRKLLISLALVTLMGGLGGCSAVAQPPVPLYSVPIDASYGQVIDVAYEKTALDFVVVKYRKGDVLNLVTYKIEAQGMFNLQCVVTADASK